MEIAVGGVVHEVSKCTVVVLAEKFIPLTTPHDLDDVPTGTAEERLEFLNDLAVTANGAVESLQVAVNDERQVVETIVCSQLKCAARLNLVHFAVTEECPNMLVRGVLDSAVCHVLIELSLVNRVDRAETHRHRWELPEIWHEARVRIGRKPAREVGLLLTEPVELVLR